MAVQNIYGVLTLPPEKHHEALYYLNKVMQWVHNQRYEMEGLAQTNAVLKISDSVVMTQLFPMTEMMSEVQAQLKNLSAASKNSTRPKIKYYCWI